MQPIDLDDKMRIIADLHIHSRYSRATSKDMDLNHIAKGARLKGLNLVGTGDCTFGAWIAELKKNLKEIGNTGIFEFNDVYWMLTTEVNTVYEQEKKIRKVHHVIHLPSFEVASQINEALGKYGNLSIDGRPTFKLSSPELVEILIEICKNVLIVPSHAWTSWYGVLGEFSGFNSLKECYQDQVKYIYALETGMSSDPAMNWRLSALDKFTLVSNSDAHSPWTWRIGREANVFELEKLTYDEIFDAIKNKDKKRLLFTIETSPFYGKYHFTGHRTCGINLHPKEAMKFDNRCPKCGRKLTVGVLQRVEKLADRPEGFVPKDTIPFKSLLPLYEIISFVTNVGQLYNRAVIEQQDALVKRFGSEFDVLLNVPHEQLLQATKPSIADAIIKVREGKIKYIPGFDGMYGQPVFDDDQYEKLKTKMEKAAVEQKRLVDFK